MADPSRSLVAFNSAQDVADRLRAVDYLPDDRIAGTVHLAARMGKPVLVEGPAGTGKTELAKSVALATGSRLIRLQCYEGLDEARALYEWDFRKQLLHIQAGSGTNDLFAEEFLLARPLLAAIRAEDPVVLLVDEVDRLEVETEALLLEVLSDYQVSVPELGTITATRTPQVFLTSNASRELSEALKRRCLFLHLDYPDAEREKDIVLARVPGISERLAAQVADVVRSLRAMDLKKRPSVSETLDWAHALVLLSQESVTDAGVRDYLHVLLKNQSDIALATERFSGVSA
ncbi:AAA family ATPase [Cryptosporangium sp. NPDC048952]|uniref:AAA family ATPase n=1 Tax=Cryptosporangium sp. NPDC048952 TaxID=3363961 RepID=UPI0037212759